ncbi:uncharacterized protein LOC130707275 [Balaenoptera acutorostrata]|uniref:Uncharacterized protein LOC130707275 n=1 Tax=Balaenoptera acutorostrata TaxID=9767 RepID=A0ABM3T4I2_BALAC|nr:uncharacterized protein LOC130707275 [Balaenoptera acutorostrata]
MFLPAEVPANSQPQPPDMLINIWRSVSVFCNCRKLPSPFRAGSKCTPRCAGLSCGRPGSAPPPRLHLRAAEMKPPGASPCRPQPGFLPLYVQRRGNSFLDTAVTETAPRPFPLSWCWESGKLGSEADPGATCRPTLLSDGGVKAPSCFAIHWPPQDSSQRRKCTKHQGSGFTELLPCTRQCVVARTLAVTQDGNRRSYLSPYNDVTQRQQTPCHPEILLHFPGCFANSDAIGQRRRKSV